MPHKRLAEIFYSERDFLDAEGEFIAYLNLVPADENARKMLCAALAENGKYESSKYDDEVEQYYILLTKDPSDIDAIKGLSTVFRMQGYIDDYRNERKGIAILTGSQAGVDN